MKILAINSSARSGGQSKTEMMLTALVKGMREAGAEVEVVNLRQKNVKYCIGCFTCWTKTPGRCVHKDDMTNELFPKWLESDLVIHATPLYHYTMNAAMKTFIERTLPVNMPFFEERNGVTSHPPRHTQPSVVMISVAGFPEKSVFNQLKSYANYLFHDRLVAEIYRPAAEFMTSGLFMEETRDILEATEQAGRELVKSMKISPETMARITQPVGDFESIAPMGNLMWKTCIAEGVTPKEFNQKGMIPRPDSIDTFMTILKIGFNPEAAGDMKGVFQFNFSSEVEGSCHFIIDRGNIEAVSGQSENPDLTIEAPFEVWMDIMTNKADGQEMLVQQKYRTDGDLALLMRMNQLFGR
ncbi:MAG: NAD(P)H-dependent oxidoreductase [Deltaproteobacteria bacterium]|nr:NAD(P)H-dependent oxidoreductase [Deltaproteobacteria bacterium]